MDSSQLARYVLDKLVAYTPSDVQQWVDARRQMRGRRKQARLNAEAVRRGHRLVPEEKLEESYLNAIHLLAEEGGGVGSLGDYLEFGVYNGSSLACMYRAARTAGADHMRLFGFDSFEGLPPDAAHDDAGAWYPGQFSMDYEYTRQFLTDQGVDWSRIHLVKGWFKDTLTPALVRSHRITKVSVIMVDCDMYSSAKEALTFSAPLITDCAVIVFDDWFSLNLAERNLGEKRAFTEWLAENPSFSATDLGRYNENSWIVLVRRNGN